MNFFNLFRRQTEIEVPPAVTASTSGDGPLVLADGPRADNGEDLGVQQGATGNRFYRGSMETEEYNQDLQGETGAKTYQKMRADAQVSATEQLVTLPIKSANWTIEAHTVPDADGNREELPEVKAFLEEALFKRLNWDTLLDHMLLSWPFGFEVMEKVYVIEDDRTWYKGIHHRRQSTICQWFRDGGELAGIEQRTYKDGKYVSVKIPEIPSREGARLKLLHVSNEQEGDNFAGRSGLRAAYGPWFWKAQLINMSLVGMERLSIGVPRAKITEGYTSKLATTVKAMLRTFQTGKAGYLLETKDVAFDIMGSPSTARYDPQPFINYCDESIAMSALAMALKLGTTQTGARALGETLFQVFLLALEAVATNAASAADEQLIDPLLELNFANASQIDAHLVWSDLKPDDVKVLSDALAKLTLPGHITKDPAIEEKLRKLLGLPPMPEPEEGAEDGETLDPEPAPDDPAVDGDEDPNSLTAIVRKLLKALPGLKRLVDPKPFWRDQTPEEAFVSLREIDGKTDDALEQIEGYVAEDREGWANTLRDQIEAALSDGDPSDLKDIGIPAKEARRSTSDVIGVQRDLFRFGRKSVKEELQRQKKSAKRTELRDEPLDDAELSKLFRLQTQTMLDGLAGRASSLALQQAMDLNRTKGNDYTDEDLDAIVAAVTGSFGPATRKASAPLIGGANNQGRNKEALAQGVTRATYSALLDENTCGACLAFDGQEYVVDSPEYYADSPPNKNCESTAGGENMCRCIWIYTLPDEQAARG